MIIINSSPLINLPPITNNPPAGPAPPGPTTVPGTATVDHVLAGDTFSAGTNLGLVGTMPNITADQVAAALATVGTTIKLKVPQGYYDGTKNVNYTDANLIAANILLGKSILGVDGSLVQGKKFASGTTATNTFMSSYYSDSGGTSQAYSLTVTGLTFQPSYVVIYANGNSYYTVFDANKLMGTKSHICLNGANYQLLAPAQVTSTGFTLPYGSNAVVDWHAYE